MKASQSWRPQRVLAGLLGLFGGLCSILMDLGTETLLRLVLEKAMMAAVTGAIAGYFCGVVLKLIIREVPQPEERKSLDVPEGLLTQKEDNQDRDRNAESSDQEGVNDREGVIAAEST